MWCRNFDSVMHFFLFLLNVGKTVVCTQLVMSGLNCQCWQMTYTTAPYSQKYAFLWLLKECYNRSCLKCPQLDEVTAIRWLFNNRDRPSVYNSIYCIFYFLCLVLKPLGKSSNFFSELQTSNSDARTYNWKHHLTNFLQILCGWFWVNLEF